MNIGLVTSEQSITKILISQFTYMYYNVIQIYDIYIFFK